MLSSDHLTRHRRPLLGLTGIRFLAAVYVIIFHSRIGSVLKHGPLPLIGKFLVNGYLAVPLFFILSGFILAYTYAGRIQNRSDYRRFFEARFARIWPVYALSLLVTFPYPKPAKGAAILLMLQSWNPFDLSMAVAWNGVCWTLSCELLFYILFPFTQRRMERLGSLGLRLALAVCCLVAIGTNSASRTLGYQATGLYRWLPLALAHVPEFLVGVGVGNLFLRRNVRQGSTPALGLREGFATYAAALLCFLLLLCEQSTWTSLIVPSFALLLYGLAAERTALSGILSSRPLLLGGGMSYSMYLLQFPVKFGCAAIMAQLGLGSTALRLGTNWIVLLAVSYIMFEGVENPARKVLRGWFEKIELRRLGP